MSVHPTLHPTIDQQLRRSGSSRRDFITLCGKLMVAAPFGLAITNFVSPEAVAGVVGKARRPSVIWLHMQDCTGCTETLLRTSEPDLAALIFDVISLDYHETVMAASGSDAEAALKDAMKENDGKYVLVVEGSIPTKDNGAYLKIAGRNGIDMLKDVANHAAAVISIGSCASWGGIPSSNVNPTGATGVDSIIKNKPVINLPGCPPNPYVLLATVLEYATTGKVPKLDALGRPKFAYDRLIHDHCPRRAHFDAGRFASQFGDSGHRQGWCLYKLGCKGPVTHAPCSTRHFNEVVDCWPIGIGAPCVGCTEKDIAFTVPIFKTADVTHPVPPDFYPPIYAEHKGISATATGVAGLVGGALIGAGLIASRKMNEGSSDEPKE
ncbi:MAG: hydrogenase small subunit [Acidobacteria bacterium]|nr:hydrogenase small subunit [Acidobacteriota bacterium]MBV9068774.1 hydrogenase small subunit [Acidobacteriota bacterium]MBV9188001.1 hydrogenase small subunit [Acidobacteriota bacterium]